MSTVSGFKLHLFGLTTLPEVLKRHSEELVAHIQRYFLANLERQGYSILCILHHRIGFSSKSNFGEVV